MNAWFGSSVIEPFTLFGIAHLLIIILYFLGIIFFLISHNKVRNSSILHRFLQWMFFTVLILSEITYQVWTGVNGMWSLSENLPLHLCSAAGIVTAIALATLNRKIITIAFFIGFAPAFLAIVTPELPYHYTHFRFWNFFIQHLAISWASVFLVLTSKVKITLKSTLASYSCLLIYAMIVGFFINPLLNANYLFLSHIPTSNTMLDLLGSGIWYYVNLCLLTLVIFIGLYGLGKARGRFLRFL